MSKFANGKMPHLSYDKPSKKHYIKYVSGVPVSGRIYDGQDRVWNYADNTMLALFNGVQSYAGNYELAVISKFSFI